MSKRKKIPIFAEFYDEEHQNQAYLDLYNSLPKSGVTRWNLTLFAGMLNSTIMNGYGKDKDKKKEGK